MNAWKIEATIEVDGELHLRSLPVRKGDRVEAIVRCLPEAGDTAAADEREAARAAFLELARTSTFRSTGPLPTREELHERH